MGSRKVLEGTVVGDAMDKTIEVMVSTHMAHRLYKKMVKRRKKYSAHDETNKAKVNDRVRIIESKPYSKRKRFELLEIVK
ncbi:MAG: 30S ribosomal protein S17 [Candidatus Omnitrophica bacterium]|nr:30S ribosomal protein S17 [Candidatus Omnitrophota bacterium]